MTQDELKSRLHYDPETGVFTWLDSQAMSLRWRANFAGKVAGTSHKLGYRLIAINNVKMYAHRLAFLYFYGFMPEEVDHIDGDPSNNKIENLRSANRKINMKNLCRNSANKSGKTGLCWDKSRDRWMVYINVNGKRIHCKRFKDRREAELQRDEWSKTYNFHENHGR